VHDKTGAMTDHNLLTAELPYKALDMIPSPESVETNQPNATKGATRIKLPLSPEVQQQARAAIEAELDTQYSALAQELERVVAKQVLPYWAGTQTQQHPGGVYPRMQLASPSCPHTADGDRQEGEDSQGPGSEQQVEHWAHTMVDLVLASHAELVKVAPKAHQSPDGQHHLPRGVSRQRQRLVEARGHLARAARTKPEIGTLPEAVRTRIVQAQDSNPVISLEKAYKQTHKQIGDELRQLDAKHVSRRRRGRIEKVQALIDTKLSVGGKLVTGQYKARNSSALLAVMDGDEGLITEPTEVLTAVERYYTNKMLPATGVKHGRYLPAEQRRTYPWMQRGAPDPFKLTTPAVAAREAGQGATLHERMADQHAFRACLQTLARGKAPGPGRRCE
jgi:hypothetical protein